MPAKMLMWETSLSIKRHRNSDSENKICHVAIVRLSIYKNCRRLNFLDVIEFIL